MEKQNQKNSLYIYPSYLLLFIFLIPSFLQYRADLTFVYNIWRYIQLAYTAYLLCIYIFQKKCANKMVNVIVMLYLWMTVTCVLNGLSVFSILWDAVSAIGLAIFVYYKSSKNLIAFLESGKFIFILYIVLNLFTVFFFPNGIAEGRIGQVVWFLGNKNTILPYILLTEAFIIAVSYEKFSKIKKTTYFELAIVALTAIFFDSSTAVLLMLVNIIGILGAFLIKERNIKKLMNGKLLLVVLVVAFLFIIFMSQNSFITEYIVEFLGKDITFNGRTAIWAEALAYIRSSPLFGAGASIIFMQGLWESSMTHAHDLFLDIAAKYGLITLVIFVYCIVLVFKTGFYKTKERRLQMEVPPILLWTFMIYLIGCIVEVYRYQFTLFFCIFIYCLSQIYINRRENLDYKYIS